jgi:hypothetical protein
MEEQSTARYFNNPLLCLWRKLTMRQLLLSDNYLPGMLSFIYMECETILNLYRCYGPCPFPTRQWYKSEVGGAIYTRQTTIDHH